MIKGAALTLATSVDPHTRAESTTDLDVSGLWRHRFPSADLVRAAGGLLTPFPAWDGREGPRARLVIAAGAVQVARTDPARCERQHERTERATRIRSNLGAADLLLETHLEEADAVLEAAVAVGDFDAAADAGAWSDHLAGRIATRDRDVEPSRSITSWSAKSRSRMVLALAQLDYAPLFDGGGIPAMLTLTYPGDWLTVAPSAKVCKGHVDAFKKRFQRAYGVPLVGVWKREFQRRGAPHYHVLMVPPGPRPGLPSFSAWCSATWAAVVAHPDPEEYARHVLAGTGLDYAEGMRSRDPKRLAVYFSKHGSFGSKDYQNHAPEEWADTGSVGRFWGVWGLEKVTATVEVSEVEARAAARTIRRWQRANGFRVQREVWRTDTRTGVMRKRKSGVRVGARLRGVAGFAVVNDGPAFVGQLVRHLDAVREDAHDREITAWLASPGRLRSVAALPAS